MDMDSNMEENSQTLESHRSCLKRKNLHNSSVLDDQGNGGRNLDGVQGLEDEHCDSEAWKPLNETFRKVQSLLDRNRVLIQLVNENHQSQLPEKLVKNVSLIREINENISKVSSIYSDFSVNFSNLIHQKRDAANTSSKKDDVNVDVDRR